MNPQLSASQRTVAMAAFILVLAAGVFAYAFYAMDGFGALSGSGSPEPALPQTRQPVSAPATSTPEPEKLELPDGMSEAFALRIWEEQIESQEMISRLVNGDITSLKVDRVESRDDSATLHCTVIHKDGPEVRGLVGLRQHAGDWYLSHVSALRDSETAGGSVSVRMSEVDVPLLNTLVREQGKSQEFIGRWVGGDVKTIHVEAINPGPNTVTIELETEETGGQSFSNLVAIKQEFRGQTYWFLSSLTKTGQYPPEL